jgi:hypothetical protein
MEIFQNKTPPRGEPNIIRCFTNTSIGNLDYIVHNNHILQHNHTSVAPANNIVAVADNMVVAGNIVVVADNE